MQDFEKVSPITMTLGYTLRALDDDFAFGSERPGKIVVGDEVGSQLGHE